MAALRAFAIVLTLLLAPPAQADPVARWQPYITEASQRFGIPEDWIRRVMRAESGGQTHRHGKPIRSRVGAMGLMQIMPSTWSYLRSRYALDSNPDDPRDNIIGGTAYLREMYDLFGYPGLFAAYNAGPARYAAYRAGRSRLPRETISYVASIAGGQGSVSRPAALNQANNIQIAAAHERSTLFVTVRNNTGTDAKPSDVPVSSSLFVVRNSTQR
jgi:soluble lytic murein transglycosylase-like protein